MAIVRWRPQNYYPTPRVDEFDRAVERMMRGWLRGPEFDFDWNPSVDVAETADEIEVKAEIPGVTKDDIDVTVENNRLIISGEKRQEEEKEGKNYYRSERMYGSFRRIFTLPSQADADKVKANFENGVLTVRIPKTEVAKGKKIDVK